VLTMATLPEPNDWATLSKVHWTGWLALGYGIVIATVLVY